MSDNNPAELMSVYRMLFEALIDALERNDEGEIFRCGEKFVRFLAANEDNLGVDVSAEVEATLKRIEPFSAAADKRKKKRTEILRETDEETQKFCEDFLWRKLREINSTPLLLRDTAQHRKTLRELAPAFEIYKLYLDLIPIESALHHFRARLDFYKKMRVTGERFALPAENIAVLATALDEFQNIYEAEQKEQGELLLAAYEARRIRKLFDEIDKSAASPSVRGGN